MARLAFPVLRRGQEFVDQALIGVSAGVGDERLHLFRRRRQTDQVETDAPDQRGPVRFRRRHQILLFQLRVNQHIEVGNLRRARGVALRVEVGTAAERRAVRSDYAHAGVQRMAQQQRVAEVVAARGMMLLYIPI